MFEPQSDVHHLVAKTPAAANLSTQSSKLTNNEAHQKNTKGTVSGTTTSVTMCF